MNIFGRKKIVVLGMMTKYPVGGVVWQTMHYLIGFQRLGYDVYYVEAGAHQPSSLLVPPDDLKDRSEAAAAFLDRLMDRFGLANRWAFHALHSDGVCYGMTLTQLNKLYRSAALIINLHGSTTPMPEHSATGRLIYLETDPVEIQIHLSQGDQETIDYLEPHVAFFTFGENYGQPGCLLPVSLQFQFKPTRQPVVLDFWFPYRNGTGSTFTTIGNWRQDWREVTFQGEVYHWSKDLEFARFLDTPARTGGSFELALGRYEETDQQTLEDRGWRVREALGFSLDLDAYRRYIVDSRGEFTVAKDQNVRLKTGWFSDRSATYLAAGRPVITQETGFSRIFPTGEGLFAFSTQEEVCEAVKAIEADYQRHCRASASVAREYFDSGIVLKQLLADAGA